MKLLKIWFADVLLGINQKIENTIAGGDVSVVDGLSVRRMSQDEF